MGGIPLHGPLRNTGRILVRKPSRLVLIGYDCCCPKKRGGRILWSCLANDGIRWSRVVSSVLVSRKDELSLRGASEGGLGTYMCVQFMLPAVWIPVTPIFAVGLEKRDVFMLCCLGFYGEDMHVFLCISKVFARYFKSVGILLRLITAESVGTIWFLQMGAETRFWMKLIWTYLFWSIEWQVSGFWIIMLAEVNVCGGCYLPVIDFWSFCLKFGVSLVRKWSNYYLRPRVDFRVTPYELFDFVVLLGPVSFSHLSEYMK